MMINRRLISMAPGAMRFVAAKVAASWVSLAAGIALWFSAARILEVAFEGGRSGSEGVPLLFAAAAGCAALRSALALLAGAAGHRASSCVKAELRGRIYGKIKVLGNSYLKAFSTAELVQLAGEGVEQLENYFGNYLPQLFYAALAPLTLLAVFFPMSAQAAVTLFLCVPLIPVSIALVQKVARRLLGKYWSAYAKLGDSFLENLQGLTTLKVYSADERRHRAMNEEAENFRRVTMKVLTMQLNSVTVMDLVAYGGTALGSILGARAFLAGRVSMGGALAMVLLASEFFLAMRALGSYFHVAMNGAAAADRMFLLLDMPEESTGSSKPEGTDFRLEDLSFSYGGSGRAALDRISMDIPSRGLVSFCGESGCGKSTLAAVLSGDLRGFTGIAQLGGIGLEEADLTELRRSVTLVSSSCYIFAGTIGQTLSEGDPAASEADMKEVLSKVRLLDFVESQGGLGMPVSERGSNLSGGQKQRLALARALLRNSPVYIFDEAASNIDSESEDDIMRVIRGLKEERSVILISHRLANVADSDTIFFMEAGAVKERGTHGELLAAGGAYARMFEAQRALEMFSGKAYE